MEYLRSKSRAQGTIDGYWRKPKYLYQTHWRSVRPDFIIMKRESCELHLQGSTHPSSASCSLNVGREGRSPVSVQAILDYSGKHGILHRTIRGPGLGPAAGRGEADGWVG